MLRFLEGHVDRISSIHWLTYNIANPTPLHFQTEGSPPWWPSCELAAMWSLQPPLLLGISLAKVILWLLGNIVHGLGLFVCWRIHRECGCWFPIVVEVCTCLTPALLTQSFCIVNLSQFSCFLLCRGDFKGSCLSVRCQHDLVWPSLLGFNFQLTCKLTLSGFSFHCLTFEVFYHLCKQY